MSTAAGDLDEAIVAKVALALRTEGRTFFRPVESYVEDEPRQRWQEANPDQDYYYDGPGADPALELEGWRILARAALRAL